jgi:hypothetical protein
VRKVKFEIEEVEIMSPKHPGVCGNMGPAFLT